MDRIISPRKKLKSPGIDGAANINIKTSVTCENVPEALFDAATAKKHFSKFGRVQRIRLFPKRQMCIIEYDHPLSAERAVLNAGAYDGFMFDVTRTKPRVRRKSKKDDDPDWVPDSDVEEELSAMRGAPTFRFTRQKKMDIEPEVSKMIKPIEKQSPIRKMPVREKNIITQPISSKESPVAIAMPLNTLFTSEAAFELHQLLTKISVTPDEKWRVLDARDRILRAWGGAGSRVKIGGATIGTCPDMCPEKELLHRQAEHQVMTLETVPDSDGQLELWRAVKQYSRSSADQEIPMCYELRPASVLMRTCAYLLNEIADTKRQVTLADWFHFMWDRLRGIRKDITQQALCCAESIYLVEMCARFHAHCAARLADLEHTQFDQKLNTDNLTKCLQTLKHMYADVEPEKKPREAEFRGYIALLNLGDANFWLEIKQLPLEIQKSESIILAIHIFNALDNNNYVKFFRLVKEKATYLQACILLRYFNDVRARAVARIVKAYAPRGGSRYPAEELMNSLAFESVESLKSFISHYGLRFGKDESELTVILDRNQFIEDMDPYPTSRAINLIESKRQNTVGEVIAGGRIPSYNYLSHPLYSSFKKDGKLKDSALIAEDLGYNTINDSNKDIQELKSEILSLSQGGKGTDPKINVFIKPESKALVSRKPVNTFITPATEINTSKLFSFKPAIPVAPMAVINNIPEKMFVGDIKSVFSFSKPQETIGPSSNLGKDAGNLLKPVNGKNTKQDQSIGKFKNENKDPFQPDVKFGEQNHIFGHHNSFGSKNIFAKSKGDKLTNPDNTPKFESGGNIFAKAVAAQDNSYKFQSNVFSVQPLPMNGEPASQKLSPGSLFKSANNTEAKAYSIFQSKNKIPSVAENIFKSVHAPTGTVYDFDQNNDQKENNSQQLNAIEEQRKMQEIFKEEEKRRRDEEMRKQEEQRKEEEKCKEEKRRKEEEKRKEEERKKQEELKRIEEMRKQEEEKRQEELKKKLEEERKAELRRKAEEDRKFKERVEIESQELVEVLINEVRHETMIDILKEEMENMKKLMSYAGNLTDEIWNEVCDEICLSEMKAEKHWTGKLIKKWFYIWKKQLLRNIKRRNLLEDTPIWLPEKTPTEEAICLRRFVENAALKNMNAIHRGYKFIGELRSLPSPEPYNIMEIIKSPLLKRMKQINYPYDKCFFWKVTLVSPGDAIWLYKKVELEKWLVSAFSDRKEHEISESLIQVGIQSWNHLMNFAISVSLTNKDNGTTLCAEAIEGTNGLLFYATENDHKIVETIEETLKHKYSYQIIPVAIIMAKPDNNSTYNTVEQILTNLNKKNVISGFKIFFLDAQNILDSLEGTTKSALKWLAKKYPQIPSLEVDYLKSICQRYLGNEIWYSLKSDRDNRMSTVLKDLNKIVKCFNFAVDKLSDVITSEDFFNYPPFPLEFQQYLNQNSPYPKPYEFIPTNARNSNNTSAIKDMLKTLKLPCSTSVFQPMSVVSMQEQIRKYCNQIGWFDNPEEVVCKVVALLPNEFHDLDMPCEQFSKYFEQYDLIDFLNIIVYEKITKLNNFENRFAVYERGALDNYRHIHWLHEAEVLSNMKHKALNYEDDLDMYIEAKRRKIELGSMDYLMLEDKDCTIVEENIKVANESISKYSNCKEAVKQLEIQIDEERKKSMELENLLKAALTDI